MAKEKRIVERNHNLARLKALATIRNFTFELRLTDQYYSQITVDEEGYRTFSENYKRVD